MNRMNSYYVEKELGTIASNGLILAISDLTSCIYLLISIDSYYRLWEKNLKSRLSIFERV